MEGEVIQLIAMLNRLMVEGDQVNGVKPPKAIEAAGSIVQTGDSDKEDDHQSSAPAVLRDVLTAFSIGGSRTELIDALTAIKLKFGAPGSRDVDVRAAHLAIDKAIEKLSNL
ncbi:hypothetical protein LLQ54_10235 [Rouxiella badensis]|uniref:hypothetical protein n=1 Tax=Rouxiella badensis TaxID=1646377 RepID=UPI001D158CCF|nr:hypothetical protein [Rouxiella badensis]MCC3740260.1 hypothetical protein [Rouxiella badensis]